MNRYLLFAGFINESEGGINDLEGAYKDLDFLHSNWWMYQPYVENDVWFHVYDTELGEIIYVKWPKA